MTQGPLPKFSSRTPISDQLFGQAKKLIPGGVNSPVRAFNGVGGSPVFFAGAEGAVLQDMDGHQYVDLVCSWGPMILGHANPRVVQAVKDSAELSTSFGAPTDRETYLADLLISRHKDYGVEQIRLVNSGTEATMSAIRLARGATGKNRIVKFDGNYHGHGDSLLVAAGSGATTAGIPGSAGVPDALAELTTVCPYNNITAVEETFNTFDDIACVIVEPVAGNMGCVPPREGFLEGLRELCDKHNALLIFDEVMTGLRVGPGSAMGRYNITPDLVAFGKVIGGGLPLAAYGGKAEIMKHLAPEGNVYQAGTLSGNPLATAAGAATVEQLTPEVYSTLEATGAHLCDELERLAKGSNIELVTTQVGGMLGVFFAPKQPENMADVKASDTEKFSRFFHGMLEEGVYLPPSAYEAWFTSTALEDAHISHILTAAKKVFARV